MEHRRASSALGAAQALQTASRWFEGPLSVCDVGGAAARPVDHIKACEWKTFQRAPACDVCVGEGTSLPIPLTMPFDQLV